MEVSDLVLFCVTVNDLANMLSPKQMSATEMSDLRQLIVSSTRKVIFFLCGHQPLPNQQM